MFNPPSAPGRIWLTEEEVQELTNKKQPAAQARALSEAVPPIPYTMVGGRPVVLLSDLSNTGHHSVKLNWD